MARKREQLNIKEQLKEVEVGVKEGVFIYTGPIKLIDFCKAVGIDVKKVAKKAFLEEGKALTPNTLIGEEQIGELCLEHDLDFQKEEVVNEINLLESIEIIDDPKDLVERAPIITIMGHVDHGKTTLLDTIRKTNVVAGESGGITQHIGAYQINHKGKKITFLDTPGHEAFTKMRARGTSVTDIVVIVVSAVDGIKPQTLESKDHALASGKPIIVAINKIDLPNANIESITAQLAEQGLTSEEWGGDVIFRNISALKGDGVPELLETITTIAEVEGLKANPDRYAMGTVLESHVDKSLGPVATILISTGTLKIGDPIVAGTKYGKIRTIETSLGQKISEAGPSMPVKITGLSENPDVGSKFMAFSNEKEAKKLAKTRAQNQTEINRLHSKGRTMEDLSKELAESDFKRLNIIIKADFQGSIAAIEFVLNKISIPNTKINIVRSSIGIISDSDIMLARASEAQIYAFNMKPSVSVRSKAELEGVIISTHTIIYKLQEEIESILTGLLDPIFKEIITGTAKVIAVFKVPKVGVIAGCKVETGELLRRNKIRLIRDGVEIYKGKITSMKITTQDVKEARAGFETGLGFDKFDDIKEGDVVEGFETKEVAR